MKLENGLLRLEFDERTGSLIQIEDSKSGQQFLSDHSGSRLLKVIIPSQEWTSQFADSNESSRPRMESRNGNLIITYDSLLAAGQPSGVSARIQVDLPAGSLEALFQVQLHNDGPYEVHEVLFPWAGGWTGIAGPGKDQIVAGCVSIDPHKFPLSSYTLMRLHQRKYLSYQLALKLPWLDISGGGKGISYICYQEQPYVSGIAIENLKHHKEGICLSWAWVNYPFIKPGQTWTSPKVGIAVHQQDWHATADRYRIWMEGWWHAPETPDSLRTAIGFQNVQFRSWDGYEFHQFNELPALAAKGMKYGVEHLCVWDAIGQLYAQLENKEDSFIDKGERIEELRQALYETKQLGCNVSTIVNMRLVNTKSRPWQEFGESVAKRTLNGRVLLPIEGLHSSNFHADTLPWYRIGDVRVLCPKPERYREWVFSVIHRLLDLGFTSIFWDQTTAWNLCCAADHGHVAPNDTHEALLSLVKEVVPILKAHNPEAYIIGECPEVFGSQLVDLWWDWPWNQEGVRPEVIRYAMPMALQSWVIDRNISEINRAFVLGFHLALNTNGLEGTIADHPGLGNHISALARLRKRCANQTVYAKFRDQLGLEVEGAIASVNVAPNCIGIILAEAKNRKSLVKLTFSPEVHGRQTRNTSVFYRLNGTAENADFVTRNGKIVLETELEPYEVAIWTL